ncbi:MAG: hydantoinase/oxoprolinase family protein [Lysobacterales bacterium]
MLRAAVDIGGTFTDLVLWDDQTGRSTIHKLPSTPEDPSEAGAQGLSELVAKAGHNLSDLKFLCHGTTVATNILLEKTGATVGMITTEGFRDILHIGRKNRPHNFSHSQEVPRQSQPLVKRRHRLPVAERVSGADGTISRPLDEDGVRQAAIQLREQGVDAVAVCCLMSFINPQHEQRIAEIVAEEHPHAFLSISHEVTPLYREYERFSTTALNAYVGPKTANYLDRFAATLKAQGAITDLNLMTSAGGIVPADQAREHPVSLLLSGPVGALILGIEVGRQVGHPSVITLDVGGTSADIGVAPDGALRMKHLLDTQVGDYDAMVPMIDIATIGAGGGSIAFVDDGDMFQVGPRSAGASPGPACYGHGGTEATVTDAMVTLGWFRPNALSGAGLTIDPERAADAVTDSIANPLDMNLHNAAAGIFQIAVSAMVEAIRVNSVSKGYDPRDFVLVAEGGAGAAFAAEAAKELSIPRVIVPPSPGVGAAAGLLCTDTRFEHRRTLWQILDDSFDDAAHQRLITTFATLKSRALDQLDRAGTDPTNQQLVMQADCRYLGQGYELTVEVPDPTTDDWATTVSEAFHDAHERSYTRRFTEKPVMVVNIGVVGIGKVTPPSVDRAEPGDEQPAGDALLATQPAYFFHNGTAKAYDTGYFQRNRLTSGNCIKGPAIVEQTDTTTVVPPDWLATVDPFGNLVMTLESNTDV